MADISKIKMPGSDTEYNIKDNNALRTSTVGNGTTGEAVGWYECKLDNGKIKYYSSGANEVEITATTPQTPPNSEVWINLGSQTTLDIPESAADIPYDNSEALITSTNVQDAIDSIQDYLSPVLTVHIDTGSEITITNGISIITGVSVLGEFTTNIPKAGLWTITVSLNGRTQTESVNAVAFNTDMYMEYFNATVAVETEASATVHVYNDNYSYTGTADSNGEVDIELLHSGTYYCYAEINGKQSSVETISATVDGATISKNLPIVAVYGVDWPGSGKGLARTDDSALFIDPIPYMADDNHPGNSPFDSLYPWSGMVKETIDGNVFVKIPKFWYKITKENGHLKFQIAERSLPGFYVSPAHRARGNETEHDYVYIGRYHCDSNYKSTSGSLPKVSITRAAARTGCHNLGDEYWMLDFSLWITIWLLYIVEFANWDSQAMIGYNCGNGSSREASGTTDSMPYHTGTIKDKRTTWGVGVQYRWIEDPWGNVVDWCDGITFNQADIYCFENPANYSDSYQSVGATLVGTSPTTGNYIQNFDVSSETGFEWFLYPSSVGNSQTNVPDGCNFNSTGVVLRVGGNYYQSADFGLFFLSGNYAASYANAGIGVRLQCRRTNSA